MSPRSFSTSMELKAKLDQFEGELRTLRYSMPLAKAVVEKAIDDAARARASLTSSGMKRDPHEKGIPSDAHITGLVGGLSRKRPSQMTWGQALRAKRSGEPMLLVPMERSIRPMNAKGETPFYANVEVVTKARTTGARSSKSAKAGSARAPRANAGQHVDYIERDEARPTSDLLASTAISGHAYVRYQERSDGVAVDELGAALLLTSIPGTTADRAEFFRKVQEREPEGNDTTLTITDAGEGSEGRRFLRLASGHDELKKVVTGWKPGAVITIPPEMHACALQLLEHEIGWTPKKSTGKRKGKAERGGDAAAREELEAEREKTGIRFVKGRSGRVQHRMVGELPHEVSPLGRRRICAGIAKEFRKRGVPYVLVLHAPNYANDERNWHFHLVWHERPSRVFTGRAEDHLPHVAPGMSAFAKAALSDPVVQQCKGMWDFEVPYTYRDKWRRQRTIYPFEQNKDRWFKSKGFVPLLRKQLADLTNAELERAGRERRVFNGTMADNDIDKLGGDKLHDKAKKDELAGIPTPIGTRNEQKQWVYQMRQLQRRHDAERLEVPKEWDRLVADARPEDLPEESVLSGHRASWMTFRYEELALRHQARRAREIAARALSRPTQMLDSAYNHLEAALNPAAPAKLRRQVPKHIATVEMASEHVAVLQDLFHDRFRLRLEAEELAAERAQLCRTILEVTGLRREPTFEVGACPAPQVDRRVTRREATQDAKAMGSLSRSAAPSSARPAPVVPQTAAPGANVPPVVIDRNSPARKLVNELARGERRLITRSGVIEPRILSEPERGIVRSDEYRRLAKDLVEVQASQKRKIGYLAAFITKHPETLLAASQDGGKEPAFHLHCRLPELVQAFGLFSSEPEILVAIKANQDQRRSAAATVQPEIAARPTPGSKKAELDDQNTRLLDRIAAEKIPFRLIQNGGVVHVRFTENAQAKYGMPGEIILKRLEQRALVAQLDQAQRMRAEVEDARRTRTRAKSLSGSGSVPGEPRSDTAPRVADKKDVPASPMRTATPASAEKQPKADAGQLTISNRADLTNGEGTRDVDLHERRAFAAERERLWEPTEDWKAEYKRDRERQRKESEERARLAVSAEAACRSATTVEPSAALAQPSPAKVGEKGLGSNRAAVSGGDKTRVIRLRDANASSEESPPAAPEPASVPPKALEKPSANQSLAVQQALFARWQDRGF